ncbi:hypothetical protein K2173_013788 [Erythroxylum novogranatense]|uniref:Uncharacterized protein n=1 Tax=Erythroxylum novogranatense TaxID=1862640 RepID=A0AAV8SCT5_9ROSI|nr:hypothetical protein K2173_013788 [Erythroxylum novogranatense]
MGRSCSLRFLLVFAILVLSISNGFGRKMMIETADVVDSSVQAEETAGKLRKMIEMLDYQDPQPNTNPRTGYVYVPSPQG